MKKAVSLILVLTMILCVFTGCKKKTDPPDEFIALMKKYMPSMEINLDNIWEVRYSRVYNYDIYNKKAGILLCYVDYKNNELSQVNISFYDYFDFETDRVDREYLEPIVKKEVEYYAPVIREFIKYKTGKDYPTEKILQDFSDNHNFSAGISGWDYDNCHISIMYDDYSLYISMEEDKYYN